MIIIEKTNWAEFKNTVLNVKALNIQYEETDGYYNLYAFESTVLCWKFTIIKNGSPDQNDFEANYKNNSNKKILNTVDSTPSFSAKSFVLNGVVKKLYARNVGIQQALTQGANTIDYVISYPWVKMVGLEVINAEPLDKADLKIFDTAAGTYSGYPNAMLNQFGFNVNLAKDFYSRVSPYDADLYQGMIVRITYNSVSAKTVGINFIMNEVK